MGMGMSGAKEATYVVLSAIAVLVGLSLIPTIIGSSAPVIVDNHGDLEATVLQFVPTGLALALLVIAFGISVGIAVSSHKSVEAKPVAIIISVIILVIGIGLVPSISSAQNTAEDATNGVFTTINDSTNLAAGSSNQSGVGCKAISPASGKKVPANAATCDFGGYRIQYPATEVSTADTAAAVPDSVTNLVSAFDLTDTVLDYVTVGFILSLLTAAFGLANMGTGGAISRMAANRMRRG
ncbi:MAG: hypothetical protein F4X54_07505 [Chloroflexi bacterium]|nr:hypothetical protein [Chloroflexota bacterium]